MVLIDSLNIESYFNVFLELYFLLSPFLSVVLLLDYLSFSLVLKLFNRFKMLFCINMAIKKVQKSGLEYSWVILFKNYCANSISQLRPPLANSYTKNRQNEILQQLVCPNLSFAYLTLLSLQFHLQKLSKRSAFSILFEIEILSSFWSVFPNVLSQLVCRNIHFVRLGQVHPLSHHRRKLWLKFFVVVVNHFYLRKYFTSAELINLVSESVSCCVCL